MSDQCTSQATKTEDTNSTKAIQRLLTAGHRWLLVVQISRAVTGPKALWFGHLFSQGVAELIFCVFVSTAFLPRCKGGIISPSWSTFFQERCDNSPHEPGPFPFVGAGSAGYVNGGDGGVLPQTVSNILAFLLFLYLQYPPHHPLLPHLLGSGEHRSL